MSCGEISHPVGVGRWGPWLFFAVVCAVAIVGSRSDIGGWNDASRLATVESLVDYHTLAIDSSIFAPLTLDKIQVDGEFYSEKPPIPAFWQALLYAVLQACFGLGAQNQTGWFCYAMTLGSSGLAYVLAVAAIYRIGLRLELAVAHRLLLAGSFAFATLALVYARQVNSHILLLAVTSWLMLALTPTQNARPRLPTSSLSASVLGLLGGLSYSIETGTGPIFLLGVFIYLMVRGDSLKVLAIYILSALPLLAFHHGVCYSIGHVWQPLGAVPEFFQWEGSPFRDGGLTGTWMHKHPGVGLRYGLGLLFGEHGFISHQPVLWLACGTLVVLWYRRAPESLELWLAGFWCLGTWGLYSALSNNYAGHCCSIRWFLPLLAPAYFVLAVALHHNPRFAADIAVTSSWGLVITFSAWCGGPWAVVSPWLLAGVQASSLAIWIAWRFWRPQPVPATPADVERKKKITCG